uniref:Uncharacterized protein n=1 Tax=Oryza barthii TaxID=65489 RepID=A0A0D3GGT9_9ORYZ
MKERGKMEDLCSRLVSLIPQDYLLLETTSQQVLYIFRVTSCQRAFHGSLSCIKTCAKISELVAQSGWCSVLTCRLIQGTSLMSEDEVEAGTGGGGGGGGEEGRVNCGNGKALGGGADSGSQRAGRVGGGEEGRAAEVGKRVESTAAMGRRWAEEPIAEASVQVESEVGRRGGFEWSRS